MSSDTASSATTTSTVLSTCEHIFCSLIPCFQQCIDRPNIIFIHGFTYHEVLWHLCWVASLSPKHQKEWGELRCYLFFSAQSKHDSFQVFVPIFRFVCYQLAESSKKKLTDNMNYLAQISTKYICLGDCL